ncbi:MAG TPA: glucosidase, partial [Kineosporiaceae bacterium]|nr:glucosidase [Kineosporiaceae bacterium]
MGFSGYYRTRDLADTAEHQRLLQPDLIKTWRHWGPYLSDRQWGTVREWYTTDGGTDPWSDLVHDEARSRAYRWGEDGILGISDLQGLLCFSVAMWNEADPIIKERLFGLTNAEGNHGEDVKEAYFYLDNLPSHAYMKGLYRYPYRYPYADLVERARTTDPLEYELVNTGALDGNRYFDVGVEYAKNTPEDILVRITVVNRGPETKTLHLLPTLWFRNTWSFLPGEPPRPSLWLTAPVRPQDACIAASEVRATDPLTGQDTVLLPGRRLHCRDCSEVLFTENETNARRLFGVDNATPFVKDGINDVIVSKGTAATVNPAHIGTKAAAHYALTLGPGETRTVDLRLSDATTGAPFDAAFEQLLDQRRREADGFYDALSPYRRDGGGAAEADTYNVQRQAFAGMLWCKQLYHLVAHRWLEGDRTPPSAAHRENAMMHRWAHLYAKDVLSMPDAWEYPWFAAWDLAFHATTFAIIDPGFAKHQLELLVMEWYQHPDGQIPAYEWDFSNINPPVHAWAAWRVYETEREIYGVADVEFLDRVFAKLGQNFTWWVNRVDAQGNNIFEGGFLGMDNIRIIDRDPAGQPIEQADGSAWVAMFCLNMLRIATELSTLRGGAGNERAYRYNDAARKYLQHFMYICDAMNRVADDGLWDDAQGFFMDCANRF